MDDSEANPMKTGLIFVPLGPVVAPAYPAPLRRFGHPAHLDGATNRGAASPADDLEAHQPAFRHLLEHLRRIPRRHVASPT